MVKPFRSLNEKTDNYFQKIIESSADGIAVVDEQGRIEYGNDSFFTIVGWPKEDLIGNSFITMLTDDTKEMYLKLWHEIQNNPEKIEKIGEAKIIAKNKELRYLLKSRAAIVVDGEKKIVFAVKNISSQKKLEFALKESEAKYRKLFENANDGIYAHDTEGNFTSINKAGLEILGEIEEEKVVGSNFSRWLAPESLRIALNALKKAVSHEITNASFKLEIVRRNNEHRWIEVNAWVIKNGNMVTGINGIARDITEKLKLEEKLKASETLFKDLFENANDPMYTHDIDGRFLSINKLGLKILGGEEEEIIGTNISKWLAPDSYRLFLERAKKIQSGEQVEEPVVIEVISKNGEHRWGEARTRLIRTNDKIIVHGICRDITENILLKQELRKSNKQSKLLSYLIVGTRGGKTRALILKNLSDRSFNAHQLSKIMNMDYKTIRHHLNVLIKNGIVTKDNDGSNDLYFISKNMESNLNELNHR